MSDAGEELVNPVTGQHLLFKRTAAETGGDLLEMESRYKPGGWPPGPHYHPLQIERFEILEGTLRVIRDGSTRDLHAGDVLIIEPGTVHEMWNAGTTWARVNWQVRPALKTQRMFETAYWLAQHGKVNHKGLPGLLQSVVMLRDYDDEFRIPSPPRAVQTIVFGPLAVIARLLGYRSWYG